MILGFGLVAALWLALRLSVGARFRPIATLLLDFGIVLMGWGLCLSLTARPLVSALVVIGLGIGLIVVDQVKRAVLREAVVFADRAELLELVRHPRLYLPFAGTGRVLAGAGAIIVGFAALLMLETPLWPFSPLPPLLGLALVLALFILPGQKPLLRRLRPFYEALGPSRDPARDAQRFGMLAGFVIHATLARAERHERRAGLAPNRVARQAAKGTIILVQSESFFDVSRLDPSFAETVLPAYSACRDTAYCAGRLAVPCWGANTIRTEFAVLTGLPESRLGLDRFNPYAAFARLPIAGLAWHARASGWQTVCVHPFDLTFYGRSHVLPMLGFDRLIGPEAFASGPRGGAYVTDVALAERVAALLDETSGGLLVFVITMEGHGPWDSGDQLALPPSLAGVAEHEPLSRFLFRQREADRAIPVLTTALRARLGRGVLAFYGDHQPSLPKAFAATGLEDERTDYMIYRSDGVTGRRRDMAAHELAEAVREAAGL
jgi:hypothetical protein